MTYATGSGFSVYEKEESEVDLEVVQESEHRESRAPVWLAIFLTLAGLLALIAIVAFLY